MSNEKEAIPLSGQWKYLPVAEFANSRFHVYESINSAFDSRPELSITIRSRTPTVLYNGMIAPLVPYKIKGAIWYQGESNVGRAEEYVSLFSTMIKSWRAAWGGEAFPFYYTQIAPYSYSAEDNSESAELRAAQFEVLQLENSGMISTLDIGVAMNIHPGNKQDVGKRLALWALAKDYDKEIVFSGPLYKSMKVEGKKIRLKFDSIGSGLVLKKKKDSGFIIAGENGKYYKAKAIIDGDEIVLSSQKVKNPKMARYTWNNVPTVTLFNKEDLPAPTFKTDFWKTK